MLFKSCPVLSSHTLCFKTKLYNFSDTYTATFKSKTIGSKRVLERLNTPLSNIVFLDVDIQLGNLEATNVSLKKRT